jgi:hypothetical protein
VAINDKQRIKCRVVSWSEEDRSGVVVDQQNYRYNLCLEDCGPQFQDPKFPIRVGEIIEAFPVSYDRVADAVSGQREDKEVTHKSTSTRAVIRKLVAAFFFGSTEKGMWS